MLIVFAMLGAILDCLILYGSILFLNKKYELNLTKGKYLIEAKSFWGVFILNFIVVVIYSIYRYSLDGSWRYMLFVLSVAYMGILALTDLHKLVIPNIVIVVALAVWIVIISISLLTDIEAGMEVLGVSLGGGLFAGIAFLMCYFVSRRTLGGGDIKMAAVLGLYVGGQYILLTLFAGIFVCAIYSVVMLIRKKITLKDGVPLAPFLYLGTIVTLLF